MSRPAITVSQSSGTVRSEPMASFSGTKSTRRLVERHHHTVEALLEGTHRRGAEAGAQQTVVGGRSATAQQVAEHDRARLLARQRGRAPAATCVPDAAQAFGLIDRLPDDRAR